MTLPPGPRYVPSKTVEEFIYAVLEGPPLEWRLLILQGARGEGKTTGVIMACAAVAEELRVKGFKDFPLIVAVVRDTWENLKRPLSIASLVLSPTGWMKAGDVSVGDSLIAVDGCATKVIGVYPQPDLPLWRVRFSDGTSAEVTGGHLWAVQGRWDREHPGVRNRRCPRNGWLPGHDGLRIATTDQLRERLTVSRRRPPVWSIPLVAPVQFPRRDVPLDPYLLGVLLGDGGLSSNGVRLTTADPEILERVRAAVPTNIWVKHIAGYDYRIVGARGRPNPVLDALRSLGLHGLTSPEKFIPPEYLWNDPQIRLQVLQGLMDTDGHATRDTHVGYTSTSERLVADVEFVVRSLGGMTRRRKQAFAPDAGHLRRGRWIRHRHSLLTLTIQLPPHINPFLLRRKSERLATRRYRHHRFIVGVEPTGYGRSVCFKIAHPSGLFVMNDFIVTHNTTLAAFKENRARGMPIEIFDGGKQATFGNPDSPAVHFWFFGLDQAADADKLQGFTCGILVLEEVAPAAGLATGVPPEALGIGATSVRQAGVLKRILVPMNPPDEDHWILKVEKHLEEQGLAFIKVKRFEMEPGEKSRHFERLAAMTEGEEAERWALAADEFDAYRAANQAFLESIGRGDLVQRLVGGQVGFAQMGEAVVPNFSKALHVAKEPLRVYRNMDMIRLWDSGANDLHPAVVFLQAAPAMGVNVLASRVGENMSIEDFIVEQILPLQRQYGWMPGHATAGGGFGGGAAGGFKYRDIGDPACLNLSGISSQLTVAKVIQAKLVGASFEPGPQDWTSRREALLAGFGRAGKRDRPRFIQIDPEENEVLTRALAGRFHYPKDLATGRILGTVEAAKRASGLYSHSVMALAYGLAVLFPAEDWARPPTPPAPRTRGSEPPKSWLGA